MRLPCTDWPAVGCNWAFWHKVTLTLGRRGTKKSQIASDLTGCGVGDAVAALAGLLAMQVTNRPQQAKTKKLIQRWLARVAGIEREMGKAILLW